MNWFGYVLNITFLRSRVGSSRCAVVALLLSSPLVIAEAQATHMAEGYREDLPYVGIGAEQDFR